MYGTAFLLRANNSESSVHHDRLSCKFLRDPPIEVRTRSYSFRNNSEIFRTHDQQRQGFIACDKSFVSRCKCKGKNDVYKVAEQERFNNQLIA